MPDPVKLGQARKARVPSNPPAPGGLPPNLGGAGTLPLGAGNVVMTDFEKAELRKLGWKDGDPVPSNFAALYQAAAKAKADVDDMGDTFKDAKDLVLPPEQDFGSLDAAKRAKLEQALRDAREHERLIQAVKDNTVDGAGPGINEAIKAGLIEDDLPREKKVSAPAKSDPADVPDAGGAEVPTVCPHCGFDKTHDDVEAPEEDKYAWLVAQEGGLRFSKEYSLLGGRVKVRFRSLTAREADAAWRQVAVDAHRDAREGTADTEGGYWRNMMSYRLVMGLEKFTTEKTGPVDNPTMDEWDIDRELYPPPNTKAYALLDAVTDAVLSTESLRRQVGAVFHRFQLLVERLEAHADDPNFWPAIGRRG